MDDVWGVGEGLGGANHFRCGLQTKDDVVLWMMLHG